MLAASRRNHGSLRRVTLPNALSAAGPWLGMLLAIGVVSAPFWYAAMKAFPVADDGWLVMITRECDWSVLARAMPDRPLFGIVLSRFVAAVGASHTAYILAASLIWATFALEAGCLWRWLFPGLKHAAPLVSSLTVAPISVEAQLCAVVVTIPCVLPAIAVYGSILLLLKSQGRTNRYFAVVLPLACLLAIAGVAFSEYAIAAVASGLIVFLGTRFATRCGNDRTRIWIATVVLALATAITYVVFLHFSQLESSRPDVSPHMVGEAAKKGVASIALNVVNGAWHAIIGGYASALGRAGLYWDTKSSLAAIFYGAMTAALLMALIRRKSCDAPISRIRPSILLLAVAVGLGPVALMGRGTALPDFGSRFIIPVLPLAAACTVWIATTIANRSAGLVAIAALGFIAGNASVAYGASAIREHRLASKIGDAVRPYVQADSGYTVAVLSSEGIDYELTARATAKWPAAYAKNFWLYDYDAGLRAFGSRSACTGQGVIDKRVRQLNRVGPVTRLLWIEVRREKILAVEPYCVAARPSAPLGELKAGYWGARGPR